MSETSEILYEREFRESNALPDNPYRGFYGLNEFLLDREFVTPDWIDECRIQLILINIGAYSNKCIPKEALQRFEKIINFFYDAGKNCIVRITYDTEGKGLEHEPAYFRLVISHVKALAPVLKKLRHKIWIFQGNFLGSWGEMHTSKFISDSRFKKIDHILGEALGNECFRAVRKPAFLRNDICDGKMALYNDGLLGSVNDLGTYSSCVKEDVDRELDIISKRYAVVPNGGEAVCDPTGNFKPSLNYIVDHMKKCHITYLNKYHDVNFYNRLSGYIWNGDDEWKGKDGLSYVEAHLGYRFFIKKISAFKVNENKVRIVATICNSGFAPISKAGKIYITNSVKDTCITKKFILCNDIQSIESEQEFTVTIPRIHGENEEYYICMMTDEGERIHFANDDFKLEAPKP